MAIQNKKLQYKNLSAKRSTFKEWLKHFFGNFIGISAFCIAGLALVALLSLAIFGTIAMLTNPVVIGLSTFACVVGAFAYSAAKGSTHAAKAEAANEIEGLKSIAILSAVERKYHDKTNEEFFAKYVLEKDKRLPKLSRVKNLLTSSACTVFVITAMVVPIAMLFPIAFAPPFFIFTVIGISGAALGTFMLTSIVQESTYTAQQNKVNAEFMTVMENNPDIFSMTQNASAPLTSKKDGFFVSDIVSGIPDVSDKNIPINH